MGYIRARLTSNNNATYLQANPCLLIWDNFEPVAGFPKGNEPLLPASERDRLKQFLKALRGGKSWVLIASRREESWLDCGYTLLRLGGLARSDAQELAAKILQTAGVDRRKLPKEYLELLQLLGGHPLSLRVVLPHLKTEEPVRLIEALRRGLDTFKGAEEEGREKSLTVSLDYSFVRLSERTRKHLPFLALFSERVDANWLHAFSESPDREYGRTYEAVFGANLQESDWHQILGRCSGGKHSRTSRSDCLQNSSCPALVLAPTVGGGKLGGGDRSTGKKVAGFLRKFGT